MNSSATLVPRSTSRLHDLILIHDSRLNVSPGDLHISESAVAEPCLGKCRCNGKPDVTLVGAIPASIAQPYFGQRSSAGRDVEIDPEPR